MKKMLAVALLMGSTGLFAQKGSFYIGGAAGFATNSSKSGSDVNWKDQSWSFSPEVGTFLTNNIQLGLGLTINGAMQEVTDVQRTTSTNFGGTLYGRYFFGDQAFKPFVGLNVSVLPGTATTKNLFLNTESKVDVFKFGTNLNAGFAYALSPRFTAVGSVGVLGYNSTTYKYEVGPDRVDSGFGLDLNTLGNRFTIGLYYTFLQK